MLDAWRPRCATSTWPRARRSRATPRRRPCRRSSTRRRRTSARSSAAGGLLGAGVDPTGNGGALPGFGDQRNYELLLEAGFTPVEVVQIMTLNGARILGVDGDARLHRAGKLADLVVIRGDLAADPAAIRNVTHVFKDGVGYDPDRLVESVRGTVGIR
jgi:hypothetical protein